MVSKKRQFAPTGMKDRESVSVDDEYSMDQQFIALVKAHDYDSAAALIDLVADINVRDHEFGATALHFAAGCSAIPFIAALEKRSDLDYGAVDKRGFRPGDSAYVIGLNEALAEQIFMKEHAQARARNAALGGLEPSKN